MPILPTLVRFALPNMGAMLATALAAIAETTYVGQLGVASLAGMALVFPLVMLQLMLSGGSMGGSVSSVVSRALGAGEGARANALAVHAMWIGLSAGALYTTLMLAFGPAMYAALGGRDEALAQAIAYSNVAFTGSIGVWLMNTFASVIRGSGNMPVPSATFLAVSVLQVLVGGALGLGWGPFPRLGMAGVAAGQVIAYAMGTIYLYAYLRSSRSRVRLSVSATPLRWELLRDILKVGALACISPLQTVLTILILTWLVAQFGTTALAGYGIGTRLEFLLIPIAFAIGVASCRSWAWQWAPARSRAPGARPGSRRLSQARCSARWGSRWRSLPTCGPASSRKTRRCSLRPPSTSTGRVLATGCLAWGFACISRRSAPARSAARSSPAP